MRQNTRAKLRKRWQCFLERLARSAGDLQWWLVLEVVCSGLGGLFFGGLALGGFFLEEGLFVKTQVDKIKKSKEFPSALEEECA